MGKINLSIDNDLERRFREEVFKRLGMKRGNIQQAIEEAIEVWIGGKEGRTRARRH